MRWSVAEQLVGCGVYSMRMARVNITMPDELYRQAKRAGVNISKVAQAGVSAELDRIRKIAALDAYLAELEAELGPTSAAERAAANEWADRVVSAKTHRTSA